MGILERLLMIMIIAIKLVVELSGNNFLKPERHGRRQACLLLEAAQRRCMLTARKAGSAVQVTNHPDPNRRGLRS